MDVIRMDLPSKLRVVLTKAASLLPSDVGEQLLAMVTPQALATMAGVVVIWAGAHFFGIGEIADVILLVVGWVAIGGVAFEAGKRLYDFAIKTNNARTEADLDAAAKDLAEAITLIGVNAALILLFRKKPGDTFKSL
jgi:enhancing lycopene biosynthesis protein 2